MMITWMKLMFCLIYSKCAIVWAFDRKPLLKDFLLSPFVWRQLEAQSNQNRMESNGFVSKATMDFNAEYFSSSVFTRLFIHFRSSSNGNDSFRSINHGFYSHYYHNHYCYYNYYQFLLSEAIIIKKHGSTVIDGENVCALQRHHCDPITTNS